MPEGWRSQDTHIKGWNVESIVETQKAKWPEFLRSVQETGPLGAAHEGLIPSNNDYATHNTMMAYAYAIAWAARKKNRISSLYWGGGSGHYVCNQPSPIADVTIDYHCKDIPLLCEGGRELFPEVKFYENEEECFVSAYNFILASSSLHYCENSQRIA